MKTITQIHSHPCAGRHNHHYLPRYIFPLLFLLSANMAYADNVPLSDNPRVKEARATALKDYCHGTYLEAWSSDMLKLRDESKDNSKPATYNFNSAIMSVSGVYWVNNAYSKLVDYQLIMDSEKVTVLPDFAAVDQLISDRAQTDAQSDWNNAEIVAESDWLTRFKPPSDIYAEKTCIQLIIEHYPQYADILADTNAPSASAQNPVPTNTEVASDQNKENEYWWLYSLLGFKPILFSTGFIFCFVVPQLEKRLKANTEAPRWEYKRYIRTFICHCLMWIGAIALLAETGISPVMTSVLFLFGMTTTLTLSRLGKLKRFF